LGQMARSSAFGQGSWQAVFGRSATIESDASGLIVDGRSSTLCRHRSESEAAVETDGSRCSYRGTGGAATLISRARTSLTQPAQGFEFDQRLAC